MSERFYRQRDKLTMNNQPIPPAQRRPKDYVPTYFLQRENLKRQDSLIRLLVSSDRGIPS